jgi:PAS domain S-box-containing protein
MTRFPSLEAGPKRFLSLSIRARLLLLVLLAILPAPAVMLHTATEQRRLTTAAVQADALRLARVARDGHEQVIEAGRQLLATLARLPEVRMAAPAGCGRLLARLLSDQPTYANLGIAATDGTVACSARPLTGSANVSARSWFTRAQRLQAFAVGDYETDITGKPAFVLAHPILGRGGVPPAIAFAAIDLTRFNRFAAVAGLPPGSTVTVIDRQGRVLARFPDHVRSVGHRLPETLIVKTILSRHGEGAVETTGPDGERRLYAFAPLRGGSGDGAAYVHVGIPTAVAFAESDALFRRNLLLVGSAGLLALVAVWMSGDLLIRRPTRSLLDATRRLAAGELGTRTGLASISGEIGELARSINLMAGSLERREGELRALANEQVRLYEEAETRGRESKVLADLARDINTSLDLDTVLQRVTEGAKELCKSDLARIALLDPESGAMRVRCWIGPLPDAWRDAGLEAGEGLGARVMLTGQPWRTTDSAADGAITRADGVPALEEDVVTAMAVPIRGPERIEGLLFVANRTARPFSDRNEDILVQLADHAAIAIRNAQVFRQEQAVRLQAESSELRYRSLYDGVPVGLYRSTPDGRLLDANPALWQMLGYPDRESLLAADAVEFHEHPEDRRAWQTRIEREGQVRDVEVRIQRRDGQLMWMRNSARAVRDATGGTLYYEGVYQDITERKRAEEMVWRYTERLRVQLQIDRAILAARSPAEVAEAALRQLRQLATSVRASLTLFDLEANRTTPLAVDLDSTTALGVGTYLPLEMAGDTEELRRGRIHLVEDLRPLLHLRPAQALHAEGVRSYMVVPLVASGELIGFLDVGSDRTGPFAPDQTELAREVADHLAVALQQARLREQIQRHAAELEQRVAERTRALEETNLAMESFAYSVSHDLRAPLRAMQGFADALLEDYASRLDAEGQEYARRIIAAARRLDTLIQDLLAYSRLSHAAVHIGPVSLESALDAAIAQLDRNRLEDGGGLVVERPLPEALGHRSTLAQILVNLLTNAFKFAQPGTRPEVQVRAERRGDRVRLWVEDRGIGIAREHQDRIFRVFERLHSVETYPGTGIGLAIVRKGVERMGGTVGVQSEIGAGSRFWIELPAIGPHE